MILTETKNEIEERLKALYEHNVESGITYYRDNKGELFELVQLGDEEPWNCFVISYIDAGEDGDQFYPADYSSVDDMFKDIVKEIEQ